MNPVRASSSFPSAPLPLQLHLHLEIHSGTPARASSMISSRVVPIYESSSDSDQSYNADIHSPSNDMVVDTDDLLNDVEAEKDDGDIAIINPEDEPVPRADDRMMIRMT
jgi:hypothetical protein